MDTQRVSIMKNTGFRIRVDDELRGRFIDACKSQDLTAAQVVREFMRTYVERLSDSNQFDLFSDDAPVAGQFADPSTNQNIENPDAYKNHTFTRSSRRPNNK